MKHSKSRPSNRERVKRETGALDDSAAVDAARVVARPRALIVRKIAMLEVLLSSGTAWTLAADGDLEIEIRV